MRVRKCVSIAFSVLAVIVVSRQAEALTINFASLESSGTLVTGCCGVGDLRVLGAFVTVDGFTFTSSRDDSYGLAVFPTGSSSHPAGGSAGTSMFEYAAGATTTISKAGEGSTFTLSGIDLTQWGPAGGSGTFDVTLVGFKGDLSTVSQTVSVTRDDSLALQSFVLTGFTDVTKVTMVQGTYGTNGTSFQFNNLIVDGDVSSVPDGGSTLSLLALAGAGLAGCRRFLQAPAV